MKIISNLFYISVFFSISLFILSCNDHDISESLSDGRDIFAHFTFNGNANNTFGEAGNGTINGSVALMEDRFGNANSAYDFSGGSIEVPNQFPSGSITIAVWIEGVGNGASENNIISNTTGTDSIGDRYLNLPFMGQDFGFSHHGDNNLQTSSSLNTALSTLANGKWVHLVLVIDADQQNTTLYLDGESIISVANADSTYENTASNNIFIGANASSFNTYEGGIDDVWIFKEALSASAVKSLYEFEKP